MGKFLYSLSCTAQCMRPTLLPACLFMRKQKTQNGCILQMLSVNKSKYSCTRKGCLSCTGEGAAERRLQVTCHVSLSNDELNLVHCVKTVCLNPPKAAYCTAFKVLSCPPKELLKGLLLGSHRDSKQESSILVLPAAGHLLRQGQSSPFPWDQSITVVHVARRKRLSSELAVHSPGRPAINSALRQRLPWEGTSL